MNNAVGDLVRDAYAVACINALKTYEIDDELTVRSRALLSFEDTVEVPNKASIVNDGALGFSGKLSAENQSDATNSYHYASLVANKKYPEEHQGQEWYKLFRKVMTEAGWSPIKTYYNDLGVSGTSARMDKLVLEILASTVAGIAVPGPATALMLKVATDAITALQKRDTALTLYERNLLQQGVGGLSAGSCVEVDGEAIMAVGTVRFLRRNTSTKVLFVDVDVRNVKMYRAETVFVKNKFVAEQVRVLIQQKLAGKSAQIIDYDI